MSIRQAIVYGSNGGIGSAVALKFLQNNYNLCLFSKNELKLNDNINQLKQIALSTNQLLSINGCAVDVCNLKSIESSIKYVEDNEFRISDLIICTGVNKDRLLIKETQSNIDYIMQTNLISNINILKYYSKLLIKQNQESSIVLIGMCKLLIVTILIYLYLILNNQFLI